MSNKPKIIPITLQSDEEETLSLYAKHKKIYPRWINGRFNQWRILLVFLTQLIFYGLPWINWNSRQALLFDLASRKFYVLGLVLLPQDFIYLTALLLCSALGLFVWTSIGGRLWCGYACPQTVYTEIFLWIEKWIEGDRPARIKLDQGPFNFRKLRLKITKHLIWILFSLWTGFTFVGFFTPIRELMHDVLIYNITGWGLFWILFYSFATYGNAGFMREQVCKYMCPYARFQSVMFDPDTLIISYDAKRGEPRGSRSKSADHKTESLGDCINCNICVQVCPTGIDIRNGLQYECIGCTACIDACDEVMDKIGYPRGLIRYTTENALANVYPEKDIVKRMYRPRVLLYSAVLLIVLAFSISALVLRKPVKLNVMRDRNALVREIADGWLENTYQLQIFNTSEKPHHYQITVTGLPDLHLESDDPIPVLVAPTEMTEIAIRIDSPPQGMTNNSYPISISVKALDDPTMTAIEKTTFFGQ